MIKTLGIQELPTKFLLIEKKYLLIGERKGCIDIIDLSTFTLVYQYHMTCS